MESLCLKKKTTKQTSHFVWKERRGETLTFFCPVPPLFPSKQSSTSRDNSSPSPGSRSASSLNTKSSTSQAGFLPSPEFPAAQLPGFSLITALKAFFANFWRRQNAALPSVPGSSRLRSSAARSRQPAFVALPFLLPGFAQVPGERAASSSRQRLRPSPKSILDPKAALLAAGQEDAHLPGRRHPPQHPRAEGTCALLLPPAGSPAFPRRVLAKHCSLLSLCGFCADPRQT